MRCKRCGKDIADTALYCEYCGKKQQATAATPKQKTRRRRGSGQIWKRANCPLTPYAAMVVGADGHLRQLGGYKTKSEAQKALQEYAENGGISDRASWTLKQFYDTWCDSYEYNKLGDSAQQAYAARWRRLSAVGNVKMALLKTSDYQKIIDTAVKFKRYKIRTKAEQAKMSPAELARYKALVAQPEEPLGYDGKKDIKELATALCRLAVQDDVIAKNYAEFVIVPPDADPVVKVNFTPEHTALLFQHDDNLTAKLLLIYIYSGLRPSELLLLNKSDVDLVKGVIVGGIKTEAGKNRVVPIHTAIRGYLTYLVNSSPNNKALVTLKGKKVTYDYFIKRMFYQLLDELGIEHTDDKGRNTLTPHRGRHTFIANAVGSGIAPEALQAIVGHAKYQTTIDNYADRLADNYLIGEMAKYND